MLSSRMRVSEESASFHGWAFSRASKSADSMSVWKRMPEKLWMQKLLPPGRFPRQVYPEHLTAVGICENCPPGVFGRGTTRAAEIFE